MESSSYKIGWSKWTELFYVVRIQAAWVCQVLALNQAMERGVVQVKTFVEQLGRATDESQQYASSLESAKRRSVEMEKELAATKSALEATNKGLEVRGQKLSDVQAELQKERWDSSFQLWMHIIACLWYLFLVQKECNKKPILCIANMWNDLPAPDFVPDHFSPKSISAHVILVNKDSHQKYQ